MALDSQTEELLNKDPPEVDDDTEVEEKPPLPQEPVDKNEAIEVQVAKPSRQEKKQNRFKEMEERVARAERIAEELRQQRQAPPQQSFQPPQQQSPASQKVEQIDMAIARMHEHYQAVASQPGYDRNGPQQKEFERQANALQTAKMAAVAEAQREPVDYDHLAKRVAWNQFSSKHSDVTNNQKAWNWAIGRWMQLVRGEGQEDTMDLAEKIMDEARIKHGMQPRNRQGSRPDAVTQRRLSGVSAQGAGGSESVASVKMGPMERKMARAMYDNLPPEQAYQKWANGPGKRAAEKARTK